MPAALSPLVTAALWAEGALVMAFSGFLLVVRTGVTPCSDIACSVASLGDRPVVAPVARRTRRARPARTASGHHVLPPRDPDGVAGELLPALRDSPRRCTDTVAMALVGPVPGHPVARRVGRALDAVVGRGTEAANALATGLDPIVFGVIGLPEAADGAVALWFPLVAWRW